jgi:hypothetical protein
MFRTLLDYFFTGEKRGAGIDDGGDARVPTRIEQPADSAFVKTIQVGMGVDPHGSIMAGP